MQISRVNIPGFDDYIETMEILRRIDRLTWAYAVETRFSPTRRAERISAYGEGLKKGISAYIDARAEMLNKLLEMPEFMNSAIPAPNSKETEENSTSPFPSQYAMPLGPLAAEERQAPDARSD